MGQGPLHSGPLPFLVKTRVRELAQPLSSRPLHLCASSVTHPTNTDTARTMETGWREPSAFENNAGESGITQVENASYILSTTLTSVWE